MSPKIKPDIHFHYTRDPAHDIFGMERRPLDFIFNPKAVAIVGATDKEGSVGQTLLRNLISTPDDRTIYPVNIKKKSVLGIKAYPSISAIGEKIDLAVIATPAPTVPDIIQECLDCGVRGAVIISAGFKEHGEAGQKLESQIKQLIKNKDFRIIGPNCLGVMMPHTRFNATFAATLAKPGRVGFISQSGALCTAILDWSLQENVGFSAFMSIGSMLDVGWGDLIQYLGDDPQTESIVLYMESIGQARDFMRAAREVAVQKPIIVIKGGRTEAAAKAAASHTGSMAGSDDVLNVAFERTGVLRVNNISELFYMAEILAKQPRPQGPNLTILTNAGGPGVLAADSLVINKGQLSPLSKKTVESLDKILPPHWSHNNPVDILGDADPERYKKTLDLLIEDDTTDGILAILTPQAMTDPVNTAKKLAELSPKMTKPVLANWMGGADVFPGEQILNEAHIPTLPYPDTAARVFTYMWRYSANLKSLYETPQLPRGFKEGLIESSLPEKIINNALKNKRTLLTELEAKKILSAYKIPVTEGRIAHSEKQAVEHAKKIGFPVVCKIYSETLTHKSDKGGVQLNLSSSQEVKKAFKLIQSNTPKKDFGGVLVQPMISMKGTELIVGSAVDPQFGPVLLFGMGGQYVEVFKDRALGLPPLSMVLARQMMEKTNIYKVLKGVRGQKGVDFDELNSILVRFSQLVLDHPRIKEIEINPLLASSEGFIALDARAVIYPSQISETNLPSPAIPPYPIKYAKHVKLPKKGERIYLRPIRPEDEPLMVSFHQGLSDETVYRRYMHAFQLDHRVAHERLSRLCHSDYDHDLALVAVRGKGARQEIMGVGRLSLIHDTDSVEFALLVADRYQKKKVGTRILEQLIEIAKDKKMKKIVATIMADNEPMQRVCRQLGFKIVPDTGSSTVYAEKFL